MWARENRHWTFHTLPYWFGIVNKIHKYTPLINNEKQQRKQENISKKAHSAIMQRISYTCRAYLSRVVSGFFKSQLEEWRVSGHATFATLSCLYYSSACVFGVHMHARVSTVYVRRSRRRYRIILRYWSLINKYCTDKLRTGYSRVWFLI